MVTHGTGEVMLDGGARPVHAGDVSVVPAGRVRGVRARGGRLVAVVTAAPPPTPEDHAPAAHAPAWPAQATPEVDVAEAIRAEHAELAGRLDELWQTAEEGGQLSDAELAERVAGLVAFLRGDLLPHAHVEDVALYPVVDRVLAATGTATATMSADHQAIAERVAELADLQAHPWAHRGRVGQLLAGLHVLLRVHLAKEEEVYLPLLARLSSGEQHDLLRSMEDAHAATGGSK